MSSVPPTLTLTLPPTIVKVLVATRLKESVPLTVLRRLDEWKAAMTAVFHELERVLKPGGHVAFEVGEVRGGKVKLEEAVIPCGIAVRVQRTLLGRELQLLVSVEALPVPSEPPA